MESIWLKLLVICPLVFAAGFADSIAGGGGVISLPVYLFAGLPIHMVYGTNKFAMSIGTFTAATKYARSGNIVLKPALCSAAGALIGSAIGAKLALLIDEQYLRYVLMILLPAVAVFLFCNRKFGSEERSDELPAGRLYGFAALIGLGVGCYDGFFGPGTGTFLTILFTAVLHFSLLKASGNARLVNCASNIGALVTYIVNAKVMFIIGIPAAVCAVIGNALGASLAIKNGARIIRPMAAVVIVLLLVKLLYELFTA